LYVSRTTVFEDLKALERRLARSGMSLERRAHTGIRLKGNEATWRRAAADLLGGAVDTGRLFRPPAGSGQALSRQMVSLIADVDTDRLAEAVRAAEERMGLTLADGAFMGLVLHLALAVKRLQAQKSIDMPGTQLDALRQVPEFSSARAVADAVEEALGVSLPPSEVGYITLHLLGARMRETFPLEGGTAADSHRMVTDRLAYDFACRAEALLGVPLKEDAELLSGLALHLAPTAERLRYGGALRNPLLDEIKAVYPQIFWAAQQCTQMLVKAWGVAVPEEEIGYLAMHLGAAIERRRSRPPRPRVLVACGSGVGTARILESRLRAELPEVEVAGVVSSLHAVTSLEQWQPLDLIISTIDLTSLPGGGGHFSGAPAIRVNPLLGAEDVARVRAALGQPGRAGPQGRAQPGAGARSARKGQGGPMLHEVMSRDAVALDVPAAGWEDAVRAAGSLLVRTGAAEERYVEAMVDTVHKLGPYIVIGKGMAMPHARPEAGSRRIGFSLVRLQHPIAFGHPEHDPVDLVFGLAAVDAQSHLTALRDLSQVLSDPERVRRIRAAESVDEVMDLFAPARAAEESEKRG
ncbi:MAG: BglG family transcription antiterminator, partial [Bacillota bacterium]